MGQRIYVWSYSGPVLVREGVRLHPDSGTLVVYMQMEL